MLDIRQSTFAGGEISEALNGRVDLAKYLNSLSRCRNGIVTRQGTWMNRPGTRYVGEVKDSAKTVRLVPFNFGNDQNFVLEFGDLYIRWFADGGRLLATGASAYMALTTYAKDAYVTYGGTTYRSLQDANTTHQPNISPTWWEAASIYEITSPYAEADLSKLKFAQIGDIITITHSSYAPRELRRYGNIDWRISTISFVSPDPSAPWSIIGAGPQTCLRIDDAYIEYDWDKAITGTRVRYNYKLTMMLRNDVTKQVVETQVINFGEGSTALDSYGAQIKDTSEPTVWGAGTEYPIGTIVQRHAGQGDLYTAAGSPNIGVDPETSCWDGSWDGKWWPTMPSYGSPTVQYIGQSFSLSEHKPKIGWPGITAPTGYTLLGFRLYRGQESMFGLIADVDASVLSFVDDGSITPDYTRSPPSTENPFATDYPACVSFFEQRRMMANTPLRPADVLGSKVGDYNNFGWKPIVVDDDAISGLTLASLTFEEIRWMLPLRALLLGTNEGLWVLSGAGGSDDVLNANSYKARRQLYRGLAWLDPIPIDNAALVLQDNSFVREVAYDLASDSYQSRDLSVLAEHLFESYSIVSWAYAQSPFSVLWAVRSDGTLLGITHSREHEVAAWHWHDTQGSFEDVCSVKEGSENAVYVVVNRTVDGSTKRYIERFASRLLPRVNGEIDVEKGVFLDSSLTYDDVPATVFSGLDHLIGMQVKVLADGAVLGPYTVDGSGEIDISEDMPDGASYVTIGLSYSSQLRPMDLVMPGRELKARFKRVIRVIFEVRESRGLKAGVSFDVNDLKEWRQRSVGAGYGSIPAQTGAFAIRIPASYEMSGRAVIQQDDPLPCEVLSITREVDLGDD